MPLQNRVTPTGEIVALDARGAFMGNRGILHDANRTLGTARWRHQAWITCVLSFTVRKRTVMAPGNYTELFFTDEAVSLAAGHRPCAECRRADYNRFRDAFAAAQRETFSAPQIDRVLHRSRVNSYSREQVTYEAELGELPEGVFFRVPGDARPMVAADGDIWAWRAGAYEPVTSRSAGLDFGQVQVLTPRPTVDAMRAGYTLRDWPPRDTW